MVRIAGTGLAALLLAAAAGRGAEPDEAWCKGEVRRLCDSDANAWKRIPWTASLTEARKASNKEGRALLVFSYEGNLETGRC